MPLSEQDQKRVDKAREAAIKAERRLVDNVIKSRVAVARTLEDRVLTKRLVAELTALREAIAEARATAP